jgi:hypothetical protein
MRKKKTASFHSGKSFRELTLQEKLKFTVKAVVFLASGGFVFPTMWID